jgi:L-alanine-DL-glutamate epimerase-like enolase superfamily enzyme
VTKVEYMPWLYPLFEAPPRLEHGRLIPPAGAGHGLTLDEGAAKKFVGR